MKTIKDFVKYSLLLIVILCLESCCRWRGTCPDPVIPEIQGITVTVQDIKTNKPIPNAQVNLTTLSKSLPTLSDGTARFTSLRESNAYQLTVSKTGYATETKAAIVEVGKNTPILFQLKPILEFVPAQLDFAAQERIKKFDIINNSDKDIGFSIKINNSWISVEPTSGTIPKDGRRVPITVTVDDRGRIPAKYDGTLTLDFGGAVPSENYPISMTVPNLDAPSLSCDQPVGITRTSAEVLGTIMSVGKTPITNHGHVWSESPSPEWGVPGTYTDFKARGTGQFTSTIGLLKPNTTYYVRAYARNENGINYSKEEYKFTTSNTFTAPGVRIEGISLIMPTTARVTAKITNNGGADVVLYGVAYSDTDPTPNPDTSPKREFMGNPSNGDFIVNLADLKPDTKYYVVAYAKNGSVSNPGPSPVFIFNTSKPIVSAKVTTTAAINVSETTATLNGNISEYGSLQIAEHGFVWSRISADPKLNAKGCDSKPLGSLPSSQTSFNTTVTGLKTGITYYYKAYVKPEGSQEVYGPVARMFVTKENGRIVHYTFNGSAEDMSGSGNNANSDAQLTTDRFNNPNSAYDLSKGTIQMINPNIADFTGELTFSIWVNIAGGNFAGGRKILFGKDHNRWCDSDYKGYFVMIDSKDPTKLVFWYRQGNSKENSVSICDKGDIADGDWHHLVITKTGRNLQFYLDGNAIKDQPSVVDYDNIVTAMNPISMGNMLRSNGCWFGTPFSQMNAQIDEFRIYYSAFNASQVKELYDREKP